MEKEDGNKTLQFAYDYLNRRVRKTVRNGTPAAAVASSTKFVWADWQLTAELDAGTAQTGTTFLRSYLWGVDFSNASGASGGAGALLAVYQGSAWYHTAYDAMGNLTGYLDTSGNVVASYEYNAYGQIIASGGSASSFAYGFATQYTDREADVGLVYYGLRYYQPKHGRFINRDPIEEAGGLNLYSFVGNSPSNRWDVLGLGYEALCYEQVKEKPDYCYTENGVFTCVYSWERVCEFVWVPDGPDQAADDTETPKDPTESGGSVALSSKTENRSKGPCAIWRAALDSARAAVNRGSENLDTSSGHTIAVGNSLDLVAGLRFNVSRQVTISLPQGGNIFDTRIGFLGSITPFTAGETDVSASASAALTYSSTGAPEHLTGGGWTAGATVEPAVEFLTVSGNAGHIGGDHTMWTLEAGIETPFGSPISGHVGYEWSYGKSTSPREAANAYLNFSEWFYRLLCE